ncbi:hypothetical protein JW613_05090 [Streptomyces smyrnaeus]|uniref:Uncharacterized protein n=1 Tax=Streptomyces smyrnaeus TaxID=1387713 RepID=A0ABS3XQV3_9ACTN|nr:hypothetical protein [Streptomyces smyrnaeus]MBO8197686.1 hypothetical protein [Streptomyces smyrnaeus]
MAENRERPVVRAEDPARQIGPQFEAVRPLRRAPSPGDPAVPAVPGDLLVLVAETLGRSGAGTDTAPMTPRGWVEVTDTERAAALTVLAWRARGAEMRHRATHDASRLAAWAAAEAAVWHKSSTLADHYFHVPSGRLSGIIPAQVQLEAAVRLLAAARTGVLPPAPYRCAVCGTDRNLRVRSYERGSGPGREELLCPICTGLPADPDEIPEGVDALCRWLRQGRARAQQRPPHRI